MKKTLGLILPLALLAFPACGDDDDGPDDPNAVVSSAFPDSGFTNRTAEIAIIGEDTAWTNASQVDFGAGIAVDSVASVGSTGLIVNITIAADAAEGARDITVDGETLTAGFTLNPPITVAIEGDLVQGSVVNVVITNNTEVSFDTSEDADGNNLLTVTTVSTEVANIGTTIGPNEVSFLAGIGVHATPGTFEFSMNSGGTVDSFDFDAAARAPMALDLSATTNGSLTAYGTMLYEVSATNAATVGVDFPVNAADNLIYLALSSSGDFSRILNLGFFGISPLEGLRLPSSDTLYIVAWDGTIDGSGAGAFTIDGSLTELDPLTITTAAEGGDTSAEAVALATPAIVDGESFDDDADQDWYSVTIAAGDDGRALDIKTLGISTADTIITVYAAADIVTPLAASPDQAFFDVLVTGALPAGDYFIRITDSAFGPIVPTDASYMMEVAVVDAPEPPV